MIWLVRRLACFLVLLVIYVLLVGQLAAVELAAGAVSAGLATAAFERLHANSARRFAIRAAWLLRLRGVPWQILRDSVLVLRCAFRPVPEPGLGRTMTIPFDSDTGEAARLDAGRRALVVGAMCASPDSFVVLRERGDRLAGNGGSRRGSLLIHQLTHADPPGGGDAVWPL